MNMLKKKLASLPLNPGVYMFKGAEGEILYVGKAKVLKNRVRSYFMQNHDLQPRTQQLVEHVVDLEYILTDTETESLMLENNLIKKYQPRYNVLLRDDKNYQFIKIDFSTEIPQIYTTRSVDDRRAKFFGPYTSGMSVRQTLHLLRYIFPYCSEKKVGKRPCFYYHLGRCPGVCVGLVSLDEYMKTIERIEKFLRGDIVRTIHELKNDMKTQARARHYERAARLRDQVAALTSMTERQKIISPRRETHDTVSFVQAGNLAAVTLFQIRSGKLVGRENFLLVNAKGASGQEILQSFLEKYYSEASDVPADINIPFPLPEAGIVEHMATERIGRKASLSAPSRGRRRKLIAMGELNAREYLEKTSQNIEKEQAHITRALFELRDKLRLSELPLRMEAYDISNTQGTNPTGSMVVFENGKPKKSDYKRFAIRSIATPNDFAMMREMLERRFAHTAAADPASRLPDLSWRLPDLILIDGGKGQLNVAVSILKTKNLKLPLIGLAKRLEEIFLPGAKSPIRLPQGSPALHLVQRIRDEAHRFAITYHRKRRSKALLQ